MSDRPSVWKQILGALCGALVAVAGYTVYRGSNSAVRAYLFPPGYDEEGSLPRSGVRLANTELTDREVRLDTRAKNAVQRMREWRQQIAAQEQGATHAVAMASSSPLSSARSVASMESSSVQTTQAGAPSVAALPGGEVAMVAAQREEHAAKATSVPGKLPSSGPGAILAALGALLGAGFIRHRTARRLLSIH